MIGLLFRFLAVINLALGAWNISLHHYGVGVFCLGVFLYLMFETKGQK